MADKTKTDNKEDKELFWADKLARQIIERKRFVYLDEEVKKPEVYTVKTSASLSGVLHIGRLSDTVRSESVYLALKEMGVKSRLIWVAEDMDPLRRVPKNVPKSFEKYIGMPVTDIPDPNGCHSSYAEHFLSSYLDVMSRFVKSRLHKYSMREEYKKGRFNSAIKELIEKREEARQIQDKHRRTPLPEGYIPWTPICENCGKIVTTRIIDVKDGVVHYKCEDYHFENSVAKGCGYEGYTTPVNGNGKLMWKGEWAAQWREWGVVAEGAGKEYQVPNSAFWVNAEIAEKILHYPSPTPIFYEHLMIDGTKMSASLGNVIYPSEWLEVAPPDMLRIFYNKRLMKTRSISWRDLPKLYDEYDSLNKIYLGMVKEENEKEAAHKKRLWEISALSPKQTPAPVSFSMVATLTQLFPKSEDVIKSIKKTGHLGEGTEKIIIDRINKASVWLSRYAPDEVKFRIREKPEQVEISEEQRKGLRMIARMLREEKQLSEEKLSEALYAVKSSTALSSKQFFSACYLALLGKTIGPRLAHLIMALPRERVISLLENA